MGKRRGIRLSLRFRVLKRDNFACFYCGAGPRQSVLHVDHVKPVSAGGTNDFDNLRTACEDCNIGKGADDCFVTREEHERALADKDQSMLYATAYIIHLHIPGSKSYVRTTTRILDHALANQRKKGPRGAGGLMDMASTPGTFEDWAHWANYNDPDRLCGRISDRLLPPDPLGPELVH